MPGKQNHIRPNPVNIKFIYLKTKDVISQIGKASQIVVPLKLCK